MLGNAELFCKDHPVALGLGQQDHKIRVVENVLNLPAGQKVFHILCKCAGDTALFAEHFPDRNKVAGGQRIAEQDMELVKVAPGRHALPKVGIHRLGDKLVCDVHGNLAEIFSHVLEHDAHHPAVRFYIGRMVKEIERARTVELQGRCHPTGLRLRLFQKLLVQVLQQRRFFRGNPQGLLPVDQPHTAVNHRFFDGL